MRVDINSKSTRSRSSNTRVFYRPELNLQNSVLYKMRDGL